MSVDVGALGAPDEQCRSIPGRFSLLERELADRVDGAVEDGERVAKFDLSVLKLRVGEEELSDGQSLQEMRVKGASTSARNSIQGSCGGGDLRVPSL